MKKLLPFFLILFFSISLIVNNILAQTEPTISVDLESKTTSANSNLIISISIPEGDSMPNNIDLKMPAGWGFSGGTDVSGSSRIGNGTVRVKYGNEIIELDVNIFNEQSTERAKARWRIESGDKPFNSDLEGIVYWSWVGSPSDGYTLNMASPSINNLYSPLKLDLTIFGTADSKEPVLENPKVSREYVWDVDLNYESGEKVIYSNPITITR